MVQNFDGQQTGYFFNAHILVSIAVKSRQESGYGQTFALSEKVTLIDANNSEDITFELEDGTQINMWIYPPDFFSDYPYVFSADPKDDIFFNSEGPVGGLLSYNIEDGLSYLTIREKRYLVLSSDVDFLGQRFDACNQTAGTTLEIISCFRTLKNDYQRQYDSLTAIVRQVVLEERLRRMEALMASDENDTKALIALFTDAGDWTGTIGNAGIVSEVAAHINYRTTFVRRLIQLETLDAMVYRNSSH